MMVLLFRIMQTAYLLIDPAPPRRPRAAARERRSPIASWPQLALAIISLRGKLQRGSREQPAKLNSVRAAVAWPDALLALPT